MKYILIIALLNSCLLHSQEIKQEFEGYIEFEHTVLPHEDNYDVSYDYKGIGKSSRYTYCKGNIKFESRDAYLLKDIFLSSEKSNYLITQNPDTILLLDATKPDVELIDFKIENNVDTILNKACNRITFKLKPLGKDEPISFRRYYFSSEYYVNPKYFENCKGSIYDVIYREMKSIPLKIEFVWPIKTVIWQAVEVKETEILDEEFEYDKSKTIINIY